MKGYSLLELIAVIVIIGILATIALSQYSGYRERTIDKEAEAHLRLIQAAQRIYRIENPNEYYPYSGSVSNITDINDNLKLFLPTGGNRRWDYQAFSTGCSQAGRFNGPDTRNRCLNVTGDTVRNTTCASCPP
jgi:prepilin-type N-terminal cleavage/methylation domain-containing protein